MPSVLPSPVALRSLCEVCPELKDVWIEYVMPYYLPDYTEQMNILQHMLVSEMHMRMEWWEERNKSLYLTEVKSYMDLNEQAHLDYLKVQGVWTLTLEKEKHVMQRRCRFDQWGSCYWDTIDSIV